MTYKVADNTAYIDNSDGKNWGGYLIPTKTKRKILSAYYDPYYTLNGLASQLKNG